MKKQTISSEFSKAVIVGGLSGIRSTAGLSQIFDRGGTVKAFVLLESIADKIPFTPARTQLLPLLTRAGLGGYAASLLVREKNERMKYAAIGALSAVACTFAVTQMRVRLGKKSRVASTVLGFAEDGIVAWAGRRLSAA